ncbi:MAG: M23 family metallopeptidase [Candidatus Rokubacteria bacterium]|nr:M23 family metallopeptidase [Candidatus Rokubacteria bacterium]
MLGLVVSVFGALLGDWWQMRRHLRGSATLLQELAEQRATIDGFNRRVAELRKEVTGWREMHGRIWEPFGPDAAPRGQTGIGGGRATPPDKPVPLTPSEELNRLSEQVIEEGENLRALDRLVARAKKALAALPSRWPVRGAVNSEFGNRPSPWTTAKEFHAGMDIAAERGTVVRAPAAATVAFSGRNAEYGLTVILDHGNDLKTVYGHLSKVRVVQGQAVERGMEIAETGNTGRSSGPHLHYEILVKGQSVNPRAYLWE